MNALGRIFASAEIATINKVLRNQICVMSNYHELAAASCHLRNYGIAQMIGVVGVLDSHPELNRKPMVRRTPAQFQNAQGNSTNHFCHVLPSGLLLNGKNVDSYFKGKQSIELVKGIFGRGIIAPDNWQQGSDFPINPAQQNIVDNIAEAYSQDNGLVSAFEKTIQYAVDLSAFNGSGRKQHPNLDSLIDFVRTAYDRVWRPQASAAFNNAHSHLMAQRDVALADGNTDRVTKLDQRIGIVETQMTIHERPVDLTIEASRLLVEQTKSETWVSDKRSS